MDCVEQEPLRLLRIVRGHCRNAGAIRIHAGNVGVYRRNYLGLRWRRA
jgi:hypothetical protein